MNIKSIIFSFIVGFMLSTSAWAEHEANHRYNVRGYVLDANQNGIRNLNVRIFSGSQLLGSITTDSDGYYSLQLHLHNSARGETLLLQAGQYEARLRIKFDASDQTAVRVHEANFIDGTFTESPLDRFRMPGWVYPVVGLFLLGFTAVMLETRRKKKIRQKIKAAHSNQQPTKHKSKKGRRKKH